MTTSAARARSGPARAVVAVARFNEGVTRRLLEGARHELIDRGFADDRVDVVWVPGTFELPVALQRALATGRYRVAVALGAVIRGETPHFDFIAAEATRGLGEVALRTGVPVGFGVLTCETLDQALARAGGNAGNKGAEAAAAAAETAATLDGLDERTPD